MAKRQRFVPGIYNYCDRWCERCPYTARCRVYRDTQRSAERHRRRGEDPSDLDLVMKDVDRNMEKAGRLLARYAKARGLDLDEMARQGADDLAERQLERDVNAHPMARGAGRYMKLCAELLEKLRPIFNEARDDAEQRAAFMDVESEAGELGRVREAFDVLCWDHMLISVKIRRALNGKFEAEREADDDLREPTLDDAAGSAWVARRCLRRSKAALLTIYEWDEQFRDEAIELLAAAEKVLRALEREIPGCITFAWPPPQAGQQLST